MRALIQRVTKGSVTIGENKKGEIDKGFVILLGVGKDDTEKECDYIADKAINLRIFEDENGKLNKSLLDVGGKALIVSQFTLYADCKKGRRPSFIDAARPETAIPLYERFISIFEKAGIEVHTGQFGADMSVLIENDGPVTIWLDSNEIMPSK